MLPWALLVAGSVASLAANVAVAEPTVIGRMFAAWPSFALTASYELLTRQVHGSAIGHESDTGLKRIPRVSRGARPAADAQDRAPVALAGTSDVCFAIASLLTSHSQICGLNRLRARRSRSFPSRGGDDGGRSGWGGGRAAANVSMTARVTVGASSAWSPATMRRERQNKADGFG